MVYPRYTNRGRAGGLPGLILELTIDSIFTYYLKNIEFNKKAKIKKPEKGQQVSITEFNNYGSQIGNNY